MGYFCSSQPRINCQLDSHRRWRQPSVALLRILPRTEWVGRDSWIRSGQDIRRTNHYISTTPESWKTLPKVNSLCKFAVFRSQHHPQRRSEHDPLLSAFWRGRAFAVKVDTERLPVFLFSGVALYRDFRIDAFYGLYNLLKVQKTGKREVVLGQPLPQTLYPARKQKVVDRVQTASGGGADF